MGLYQTPFLHCVSRNPHNHSMKKALSFPVGKLRHEVTCLGSCSHGDPGSLPLVAMDKIGLNLERIQSPPQDFCDIQWFAAWILLPSASTETQIFHSLPQASLEGNELAGGQREWRSQEGVTRQYAGSSTILPTALPLPLLLAPQE